MVLDWRYLIEFKSENSISAARLMCPFDILSMYLKLALGASRRCS
jgi:hypothetical protein